jgi:hypothetical protein
VEIQARRGDDTIRPQTHHLKHGALGRRRIGDTVTKQLQHKGLHLAAVQIVSAFVSRYDFDTICFWPYRLSCRLFGGSFSLCSVGIGGFDGCFFPFSGQREVAPGLGDEILGHQALHDTLGQGLVGLELFTGLRR